MTYFIIFVLCIVTFAVNSIINSMRLSIVKKYDCEYQTVNDILAETHPVFNVVTALLTAVCPITIIVIAIQNFIGLL